MKIIHCADLHLDSNMTSNLSREQAKQRKAELLATFERMIAYAKDNFVKAVIIAGDLYDIPAAGEPTTPSFHLPIFQQTEKNCQQNDYQKNYRY